MFYGAKNKNSKYKNNFGISVSNMKKFIITFVFLILISTMLPVSSGESVAKTHVATITNNPFNEDDVIFHTEDFDTHKDYGEYVAKEFRGIFSALFLTPPYLLFLPEIKAEIAANLLIWKEPESDYYNFYKEIEGVSTELKLSMENTVFLFMKIAGDVDRKCSATVATGEATEEEGATFLHQNLDSSPSSYLTFRFYTKHCSIQIVFPH